MAVAVVVVLLLFRPLALVTQVLVQIFDCLLPTLDCLGRGLGDPLRHLGGDLGRGLAQEVEVGEGVRGGGRAVVGEKASSEIEGIPEGVVHPTGSVGAQGSSNRSICPQ